ncbi:uncharacterized protein LOC132560404 [Ylistrum balloti]|uniref:uncharacterized protein LOC132560404 n=1 Tax=Ylistrum balloti TaxID=509963 RepID=UPI0029058DB8|nr:uncharacterized protein LOC132560404 [Ylistrum balloti]
MVPRGVLLWACAVLWAAAPGRAQQQGCATQADVTFILDSSNTVGQTNFEKQKDFVKHVVGGLKVDPNSVRISTVTYNDVVHNQFFLNQHNTQSDVINAISAVPYTSGSAHTADALQYVSRQSFNTLHGGRTNVPHIAILVTDGPSITPDITKFEAQNAKDKGIIMYSVGVGGGIDRDELTSVASDPKARYMMTAENYDSLNSISNLLASKICNELPPNPNLLSTPSSCLQNPADVVFMVDSSSNVGNINFMKMQNFIKNTVADMNIQPNGVHVGLMQYSSYPSSQFPLNQYTNRGDVLKAVEHLSLMGGGSNTADAISYTRDHMFSQSEGGRSNVPRIAILLTDGDSNDMSSAITAANKARDASIGLISVGIGGRVNQQELAGISPSNVINVNSFDQLDSIKSTLLQKMCGVKSTFDFNAVTSGSCVDTLSNCAAYGRSVCTSYKNWASSNCQAYCGICKYQYQPSLPSCTDKVTNCAAVGCTTQVQWARDNCKLTCGYCGAGSSSSSGSAVGFYGRCAYKGKTYSTGEKWTDGCDYECVCQDGNSGQYNCYNRCPVYYDLPSLCTLVRKPGECCLQPTCNFASNVQTIEQNSAAVTPEGYKVCAYKGKQYFERQTWKDGCSYQCTCVDASTGHYRCEQLCPAYNALPSYCNLVQTPGQCCQQPVCEFSQQHGSFSGQGQISGQGAGLTYTPPSACNDVLTNCQQYDKNSCTAYPQWAQSNCRLTCGLCSTSNQLATAAPGDRCVYEGKTYTQGQTWSPSCSLKCTCEAAKYGYYRCVNQCPTYNNLPSGCNVRRPVGYCCEVVECQTGSAFSSSQNINSIGNGGGFHVINPAQGLYPAPTAYTGGPISVGAGGTGFQPNPISGCLFNGQVYYQNQPFDDGCARSCVCLNATSGQYSCRDKCPVYQNMPSTCVQVTDANDPCCTSPKCTPDPVTGQMPNLIPVFQPAITGIGQVQPPVPGTANGVNQLPYSGYVILSQTGFVPPPPTVPAGISKQGYCVAKSGQHYAPGESWEEGCDYNCICDNGLTGHYTCVEKCYKYEYVPNPYCQFIRDPKNPCCVVPQCYAVPHGIELTGVRTTPLTKENVCTYEGETYQQGQTWYDGCSYKCTCEDALNGIYRCTSRCPDYLDPPAGCTLIADPRDPTCCRMPKCNPQGTTNNITGTGQVIPNPIPPASYYGKITGEGKVPGYCIYKGTQYTTGQIWEDGCDLTCECKDSETGVYQCTDRCQRYTGLPSYCRLVNDFANPCCKKPECNPPGSTGVIDGQHPVVPGVSPSPTAAPNPLLPSPLPQSSQYCVYKGANYIQGQTWEDGCNYKCRCDDSSRGIYTCLERCAKFDQMKEGCTLISDPEDGCCLVPVCPRPTPGPGQTNPPGPTPVPTLLPHGFTGQVHLPTPEPVPGQPLPTPKYPLGYCYYKGDTYTQGQTWDDGCDYTCVCTNASTGAYKCNNKCPRFVELPRNCRLVKDPTNPCCKTTECYNNPTPAPTPGNSPIPGVSPNPTGATGGFTGNGPSPSPTPGQPNPVITQLPVQTPRPQGPYQPVVTPGPLPKNVCVYKGKSYTQGQQWYDGCDFTCICEDGTGGVYRCNNRCPQYAQPASTCTMVPDPKDPLCCKKPSCPTSPNQPFQTEPPAQVIGGVVTPKPTSPNYTPGIYTNPPVIGTNPPQVTNSPRPGETNPPYNPTTNPLIPTPQPPTIPTTPAPIYRDFVENMCVYKGKQYATGQRWQDGCSYDCICQDGKTGLYKCDQKCTQYTDLQPGCQLVRDVYNPCCMKPYCAPTDQPPVITITPPPGQVVTNKPKNCMYNGVEYKQGQTWADGCDLNCICEDGTTGFYRCSDRCPHYGALPAGCVMETSPSDPCCRRPKCNPNQMVRPTLPFVAPTLPPGVTGPVPTPKPTPIDTDIYTNPPPIINGVGKPKDQYKCMYKGIVYNQGDTWQDGCDLDCECIDEHTGRYRCVQRCRAYNVVSLPPTCNLVVDPQDQCCKVLQCVEPVTPAPTPFVPFGTPGVGTGPIQSGTRPPYTGAPTPSPTPGQTYPPNYTGTYPPNYTPYVPQTYFPPGYTGTYPPNYTPYVPPTYFPPGYTGTYPPNYTPGQPYFPPGYTGTYPPNYTPGKPYYPPGYTGTYPPNYTPPPSYRPNYTPRPTPAPTPKPKVCVYMGNTYTEGQQWYGDSCSTKCVCEDGSTGYYRCVQRCASYPNLPSSCTLVPDPKDPQCCQVPRCYPGTGGNPTINPSSGPVLVTGFPGKVTGFGQTTRPPVTVPPTSNPYNPINTQPPVGTNRPYSPIPGVSTPQPIPGVSPSPTPSVTPAPKVCIYKGNAYQTGQRWQDGCQYNCICEDGMTGKYVCTERCSVFPQLPRECRLQRDPKDYCCMTPVCDYEPTTTPPPTLFPPNTNNPPGTGPSASPRPNVTPPPAFCLYNGVPYQQGQTWDDGCKQKCRCDEASKNIYTCFDRCKSFPDLPQGCTMVTDPNDPCCQLPECSNIPTPVPTDSPFYTPSASPTPQGNTTPNPYAVPTLPGGVINGGKPTPSTGNNPFPQPNQNPKSGKCEYKGSLYNTGDKWDDGCSYKCVCIDEVSGRYTCTEKCPRFAQLPVYCYMVQDTKEPCCKVPYCPPQNTPNPNTLPPTPPPTGPNGKTLYPLPSNTPGVPTQPPTQAPREGCVMNGKLYTQGQTFYDGCQQICVCQDGKTGHVSCRERCPQYDTKNLSPLCILVPSPKDPLCCKIPKCEGLNTQQPPVIIGQNTPSPSPTSSILLTPPPGQTYTNNPVTQQPPPQVCVYKGRQYSQGQRWQDGCDYTCECVDASIGRYKCVQRCTNLVNVPLNCQLKYNPQDPCCPNPDCGSVPTPGPGSTFPPGYNPTPSTKYCIYNGVPYRQGQSWDVGCEKRCVCEDATTGIVNCDERCPTYPALHEGCRLLTDPNDQCCQAPLCINPNPSNPYQVVTGPKGTFTGGTPINNPNQPGISINAQRNTCVYHGKSYNQGDKWDDGCLYQCECLDSSTGRYKCTERCQRNPQVPSYCTLVQDPNDQCCQVPYCPLQQTQPPFSGSSPIPGSNPNPTPGGSNPYNPQPIPGQPGSYTPTNMCVYNGQVYRQGQQWYDGCDLICRCENSTMGFYRCQQRCSKYNNLPSGCTLTADPKDPQCCQVPQCPLPQQPQGVSPTPGLVYQPSPVYGGITGIGQATTPLPTPQPTMIGPGGIPVPVTLPPGQTPKPTPAPTPGCLYKGRLYSKGQMWDDGCEYHCECLDDMTGRYRCTQRCNEYPNLPQYCTLVKDPRNPCCPVPYCDQTNPNVPIQTVPPQYQPFTNPTTPNPFVIQPQTNPPVGGSRPPQTATTGYCVYNGVYYKQGQSWNDGCKRTCTCDDSSQGLYSCKQRCPTFDSLPNTCHLIADPNDACCVVPDCNTFPTHAPRPTSPGGVPIPGSTSPLPIVIPTPVQQSFTGGSPSNGNLNPQYGGTTGNNKACVYKGQIYHQGQSWNDGCDYKCTCYDEERGQYRCSNRCPSYYNLPAQCTYIPDPQDTCCRKASCDLNHTPPPTTPTTPFHLVTVPAVYPTATGTKPPDMCKYTDNSLHAQGAKWDDGCNYRCTCMNATFNIYRCDQRCTAFSGLPAACTLVQDPQDQCCQKPQCNTQTGISLTPQYGGINGSATPPPNTLNVLPIGTHDIFTGSNWNNPGIGPGYNGGSEGFGVCVYKGKTYQQGQSWSDGCDYSCTCENSQKGEYKCVSRCPQLPSTLPSYCSQVSIPGQCCPRLTCDVAGLQNLYHGGSEVLPTPAPTDIFGNLQTLPPGYSKPSQVIGGTGTGTQGTISGTSPVSLPNAFPILPAQFSQVTDQCIYQSKTDGSYHVYDEGAKWKDGCDFSCVCKDGKSGYYECTPLCPVYNNLPSSHCYLTKEDDQCCATPLCQLANGQTINPLTEKSNYTLYGTINGGYTGVSPNHNTSYNYFTTSNYTSAPKECLYKGRTYLPGQQWIDGCNFVCSCQDGNPVQFECRPRCPIYTSLPSFCHMEKVADECCEQVACDQSSGSSSSSSQGGQSGTLPQGSVTTTTTKPTCSWCRNQIDNCPAYGQEACKDPYKGWATRNCESYCGFCDCQHTKPPPTTPTTQPSSCHDKLDNCQAFGKSSCTGIFENWARTNCQYFCDYCPKDGDNQCVDVQPATCQSLKSTICSNPSYVSYAEANCKSTCDLCNVGTTAQPATCMYKGTSYQSGQTWMDGCDKNCSCDNGVFKCKDLCPKYVDLPANWVLKHVDGQCCDIIVINDLQMCNYKGQSYAENAEWEDGCTKKCKCTNAEQGLYECRDKCPLWHLPDICHWDLPKPGKCCRQPSCPPPYQVQGYPDE